MIIRGQGKGKDIGDFEVSKALRCLRDLEYGSTPNRRIGKKLERKSPVRKA